MIDGRRDAAVVVGAAMVLTGVLEPVLGTRLTTRINAVDELVALAARSAAEDAADRLEAVLSAYRPDSPFNRWRRGELVDAPPEVVAVVGAAIDWHRRSGGAFNPNLGAVMAAWRAAEMGQRVPDASAMRRLASGAAALPFSVEDATLRRVGDCGGVDVHGLAKGWVVDRMVEAALAVPGVASVLVDLGGDVRHAGVLGDVADVAIEDPQRVADNAPPLTVVRLAGGALASSGGGRRGWRIRGRWYGHLLDPATGWPLPEQRAATVAAASAVDADAAASAAAVLGRDALVRFCDEQEVAALTVSPDGRQWRSRAWVATVEERSFPPGR